MGDHTDVVKNLASKQDKAEEGIQKSENNNAEVGENQTSDALLNKSASDPSSQSPDKSYSSIRAELEANLVETNRSPPVDSTNIVGQTVITDKVPIESQSDGQLSSEPHLPEDSSEQCNSTDINIDKKESSGTPLRAQSNLSLENVRFSNPEDNTCDTPLKQENELTECSPMIEEKATVECSTPTEAPNGSFTFDHFLDGDDSGTEEEQSAFMKELENFYRERNLDFKPPKFYGEGLNCLKLWREVTKLGGHEQVTTCKLWRQVGESFKPPKTCTTVSWTFRIFYEKALLEYEKYKIQTGQLQIPPPSLSEPIDSQVGGSQASGSGRARRDAAARAMQGWHSQRLLGNGEVGHPIIKDKNSCALLKKEKNLKCISSLKKRKSLSSEHVAKVARTNVVKPQGDTMVVDVNPADWVKINVRRTKDCFEVYALVPGLLREEVQVQSDPAGRLIISGEPEQPDNPWGVTPFKKVITLPSQIDPHQTSAVVTLHGQLFVRAPFGLPDL